MADVILKHGLYANYEALASKDSDTLYFTDDTHQIFKGSSEYTKSVFLVEAFPEANQEQGRLYIAGNTGKVWNGTQWVTVFANTAATPIVDDLTTGGSDQALSAEQGKILKGQIDTHEAKLTGTEAGHVRSGADAEITDGLITIKRIGGTEWTAIKSGIDENVAEKAPSASPTFTGVVTVPTPTETGAAANKGYVDNVLAANDAMRFKGTLGTDGTITALPTTFRVGDTYRVITSGTFAGASCEVGDLVIAMVNRNGTGTDADWTVAQTNIDGAVVGPASAADGNVVLYDGTTGKRIKDSTITGAAVLDAISKAHNHANKEVLDSYDKTQADLLAAAKAEADSSADAKIAAHVTANGHTLVTLADVLLNGENAPTDGQVMYYDATDSKWKAKTIAVDISGKLDKVASGHLNEVVVADADGTVKASGKKVGGSALSATPDANTLATEAAVKTAADNATITWGTI